jgi:hypothetical protein
MRVSSGHLYFYPVKFLVLPAQWPAFGRGPATRYLASRKSGAGSPWSADLGAAYAFPDPNDAADAAERLQDDGATAFVIELAAKVVQEVPYVGGVTFGPG